VDRYSDHDLYKRSWVDPDCDDVFNYGPDTSVEYDTKVNKMKRRYAVNKAAAMGSSIKCAGCAKSIVKVNYQTQFCRNKGQGNCKDKYWNNTSDARRLRAQSQKYYN